MYLLDTHVLIWTVAAPARLSAAARAAAESGSVRASVVSLWELIVKKHHRIAPVTEPMAWWQRHVTRTATEVLAVRLPHLAELDALPAELHGDPFDRMLVAQARAEHLHLVTADRALARYDVEIVW